MTSSISQDALNARIISTLPGPVSSLFTEKLIAGFIAGLSGCVVGHPFDTIRVRIQNSGLFSSATDCFLKTIHTEGPAGLYRGIIPPLLTSTILKASMFSSQIFFLKIQVDDVRNATLLNHLYSGLGVGLVNSLLSTPVDRAKILLQVQNIPASIDTKKSSISNHINYQHHNYSHKQILLNMFRSPVTKTSHAPFSGVLDIFRKIGFVGMYQGLTPSLGREMIGASTYFTTYEILNRIRNTLFNVEKQSDSIRIASSLTIGAVNGIIMWTVMLPIDVLKSRIQAQVCKKKGTMAVVKELYQEGGIQAFYRGWRPAVARAIPAHAAIIGTYELVTRLLFYRNK